MIDRAVLGIIQAGCAALVALLWLERRFTAKSVSSPVQVLR